MKVNLQRRHEVLIGNVLKYGVATSTLLIALGVLLSTFAIGAYRGDPSTLGQVCQTDFGGANLSLNAFILQIEQVNPLSIIQLGVFVLIAVPFFRVASSIVAYAIDRDWIYVGVASLVLVVLILSMFIVAPSETKI